MSADMNARLADLALRMATVFSTPAMSADKNPDAYLLREPADSLLGEDLPQLAEAMLVLALRMLDPILAALRGLAAGTPEASLLENPAGPDAARFDSNQVRMTTREGRLVITGCKALPLAFLPWMASNLVGAGALLVPRPFADPEALRRHIGETLQRIELLTEPQRSPLDRAPAIAGQGLQAEMTDFAPTENRSPAAGEPEHPDIKTLSGPSAEPARTDTESVRSAVRPDTHAPKR